MKKLLPLLLLIILTGCEMFGFSHGKHRKNDILPPSTDWTYVWIAGGSVIGIGIGVALAVALPGDDHVPYAIICGCSAALILCLVIGTIKAIVTWTLIAGCIVGALWLIYKLYGRAKVERIIRETT